MVWFAVQDSEVQGFGFVRFRRCFLQVIGWGLQVAVLTVLGFRVQVWDSKLIGFRVAGLM